MDIETIKALHQQFHSLGSYKEKLYFFDAHWTLIPFTPPPFDPELQWLSKSSLSFDLYNLFLLEQDRRKDFYIRTFGEAEQLFFFSINPLSKNQRIILNRFIVAKFLATFASWEKQATKTTMTFDTSINWEQKLENANNTLRLLSEKMTQKNEQQLQGKFLHVFFKGYVDKSLNEEVINKRKRFVELFLYAQGILYSQYVSQLEKKIAEHKNKPASLQPLFNKKLEVMEKMGFFSFLKKELCNETRSKNKLIKEIYFLLSGQRCLPTKDENLLIENFLLAKQRPFENRK